MKYVDQETLHAEDTPPRDSTTSPIRSDVPVRQMRQGTLLSRVWVLLWQALHSLHFLLQKIHRKRVPELRQISAVECGLACLAMILSYYGRKTSISELRINFR